MNSREMYIIHDLNSSQIKVVSPTKLQSKYEFLFGVK